MLKKLDHFTGSETFYRHQLCPGIVYTDGAKYVADQAGAYWLLDKIATVQIEERYAEQRFQTWNLIVKGHGAILVCDDGNGVVISSEEIAFTDFPAPGITLWYVDRTILLPSEY